MLIGICALTITQKAAARAKIPFGKREVLTTVADLPNTEDYLINKTAGGKYLDLATLHEEYNIAWILPLWITKEPKLVGYNKQDDLYYEIPDAELQAILKENKLDEKKLNKIGFYSRYGGKLVALTIILLIIWAYIKPEKKKAVQPQTV